MNPSDKCFLSFDYLSLDAFFIETIQFTALAFVLFLYVLRIFAHIWGRKKMTLVEVMQLNFLLYGVLWFFLYTDQEPVLIVLSISCMYFSFTSFLFVVQLKKSENLNRPVLSKQSAINGFFNFKQYQKSKYLLKKLLEKRLKNKDINLIWEVPFIFFFSLNLVFGCGICFPSIQKAFFLRLSIIILLYNTWYYIIWLCFIEIFFVLFPLLIQKYFRKRYGKYCKVLYSKEKLVLYIKDFFVVLAQSFGCSVILIYVFLFFYHGHNIYYMAVKKGDYFIAEASYTFRHCIWENTGKGGPEPILDPLAEKIDLNSSLFKEVLDLLGLNYEHFEHFNLMLDVSDLINYGLKIREVLVVLLNL